MKIRIEINHKVRIVGYYHCFCGEWYIIQRKILFWWVSYGYSFRELSDAVQFIDLREKNGTDLKLNQRGVVYHETKKFFTL